ncbi:MAG TPA: DUF1893 domain-containing protein [Candidatus Limnocylindrales bacterium]
MSAGQGPVADIPAIIPPLPPRATMALWPLSALAVAGEAPPPVYTNGGKWLHPLFDLLELLSSDSAATDQRARLVSAGELFLRDRVIGRGAAFLILRAGIRDAWADVVSDGAFDVFEASGARLGGGERVAAIGCRTESLLRDVRDAEEAWTLLLERRVAGAS